MSISNAYPFADENAADDPAAFIRTEVETLCRHPIFERSAVMQRLLRFLAEKTISGDAEKMKSYEIAVEGLGRDEDFDASAESYPRVQVARLRKLLDAYYGRQEPPPKLRLTIPSGSYAVEVQSSGLIGSDEKQPSAPAPTEPAAPVVERRQPRTFMSRFAQLKPFEVLLGTAVGVAVAILALALVRTPTPPATDWTDYNFPIVEIGDFTSNRDEDATVRAAQAFKSDLVEALARFDSFAVAARETADGDYVVNAELRTVPGGTDVLVAVEHIESELTIWTRSRVFEADGDRAFDSGLAADWVAQNIGHISGVIHSHARSTGLVADTPYGCWLVATSDLWWRNQRSQPGGACVEDWLAAVPEDPMALALSSWQIPDTARKLFGDERREAFAEARARAERAMTLDPNSTTAALGLLHIAVYQHDEAALLDAAARALAINANDPDVQASVGVHLALAGFPEGGPLIDQALERHTHPAYWFFLGKLTDRVLADDIEGALEALTRFDRRRSTPLANVLAAMLQARQGDMSAARDYWRAAVAINPRLEVHSSYEFDVIPLAPDVKRRFMDWLEPVVET